MLPITKEQFCSFMSFIMERQAGEQEVYMVLNKEFDDFNCFFHSKYETQFVTLLSLAMNDVNDWISYFIYELDFGRQYKPGMITETDGTIIDLSTSEKLYEFLLNKYTNKKEMI